MQYAVQVTAGQATLHPYDRSAKDCDPSHAEVLVPMLEPRAALLKVGQL